MSEFGSFMTAWWAAGKACELAAGSTPMSCSNGLKGSPFSNSMLRSLMSTRSEANGA